MARILADPSIWLRVADPGALQFIPASGHFLLGNTGHLDEIHRREAVEAHELVDLALDVPLKLPAAVIAGEVIGRKADEQDARMAQAIENAVSPVVHVLDRGRVEEDAPRLGGEALVVGEDFIAQDGDPAFGVAWFPQRVWKAAVSPAGRGRAGG